MNSSSGVRLVRPLPRFVNRPLAVDSSGPDAIRYAEAHGLVLDDWQMDVVNVGLGEAPDGLWAAREVDELLARRNGKNVPAEVRELYGLGILGEWQIHTAHLFKTTRESYNRLLGHIEKGPLNDLLKHKVASPGTGYTMWFTNGARIDFIARSKTSGRGLDADLLVLDEAQDLDDDALDALLPTQSARENPQTWYMGSAPRPHSLVWHRKRKRGRESPGERMAYFEYSADPKASLDDVNAWRDANPALGIRISLDSIQAERDQMSDEGFACERLSISPDLIEESGDELAQVWARLADPDSMPEGRVAFALSVSPNGNSAAIGVAGVRADGLEHVEIAYHKDGTGWLIAKVVEMAARYDGFELVAPSSGPAGPVVAMLEHAGVTVRLAKTMDASNACGGLLISARDGRLRHRGQRPLDVAVAGAKRKEIGDSWVWGRKTSTSDVSPLEAVTLARWALGSVSEKPAPLVFAY